MSSKVTINVAEVLNPQGRVVALFVGELRHRKAEALRKELQPAGRGEKKWSVRAGSREVTYYDVPGR